MARGCSRAWLATAVVVSAALVLSAPFIAQLRDVLRETTGERFALMMAVVVVGAVGAAVVSALRGIREQRGARYTLLAAAVLIAVAYAVASRTGNPEVDAVERVHFIEYGVITFLFYRAWRPAGDASVLLLPVLAAFTVGVLEEWLQWFVPARIGEVRDVWLNTVAIGCGLLFCLGADPPAAERLRLPRAGRRRVVVAALIAIAVFGAFFQSVHLGHEIADREAGVFRSRYTAAQLEALAADRAARWRTRPPLTRARLAREDQYFSEGVAHVQRRNRAWQDGNVLAAHHENLILEKYYAPVLDTAAFASETRHRWPDEQRAEAGSQPGPGFMIYDSDALPYPVFTWPPWLFWGLLVALAAAVVRLVGYPF